MKRKGRIQSRHARRARIDWQDVAGWILIIGCGAPLLAMVTLAAALSAAGCGGAVSCF